MNNTSINSTSTYKSQGLCARFPPKTHSLGIWDKNEPFTYAVPALEVQMVVIFAITHLLHLPLKRLGIPKLFSEIMAGIILGPTLPKKFRDLTQKLFPIDTQGVISTLTLFGYMLFMFLVGVKTDLGVVRTAGRKAFAVGILALMVPFMIGSLTTQLLIKHFFGQMNGPQSLFFVSELQATSPFVVVAMLLKDLKILNSELGRLAVSSSLSCEVLSITFAFIMNTTKSYMITQSLASVIQRVGLTICFILVVIIIIKPAMLWVIRQTPEGRPVKDSYIYCIILVILLSGAFSHWIGEFPILGPFILGFAIPDGPPLGSALVDKLDSFVSGLFIPLFMTMTALRVNLKAIRLSGPLSISTIIILIVSFLAKLVACVVPACICRVPFKDALALGLLMNAKGIVQMSFYSFFRDDRIFGEEIFSLLIVSTTVAALFIPLVVKQLYDPSRKYAGYQRRNITESTRNGHEIRVVLCIHRPDNILAFLNLLDVSQPSRESPIMVYALHLIELHGRASPLFLSHHCHQSNENSYSGDVVYAFSRHERQNQGSVCTQAFTAISPHKLMHEDICTLALNKLASLIILPFHKKWAVDGSIESEDLPLRSLNCKILEMAPCSVGILIDRGLLRGDHLSESSQCVALIFFGGNDDQEALIYAKRMVGKPGIILTVVRFISKTVVDEKENTLDSDTLNDVISFGGGSVSFVEEVVKDGPETALILREMVNEFDLIIVGNHGNMEFPQTSGLREWAELPELGVVGDILASSDLKGRASVFVVQQQKHMVG
ncbi:Cation/H(+) antiporter like [Actinidia chinensis var. chinensis]|uniref:Cation/H(+) antiporter like n=1 Tax=Actinidia chinensis var. chinensis TaxID=1590841 RepID=A0A2R6PRS1_ACTCC|nr:Cation/H(+) antiporter like [Actinidia chinensis var. chinensis]